MNKKNASDARSSNQVSRRDLLLGAATGAVCLTAGTRRDVAHAASARPARDAGTVEARETIDLSRQHAFYGTAEQAGVMTPQQRHIVYTTFDLATTKRSDLQVLLARWSAAIARLMKGESAAAPLELEPSLYSGVGFETGEAHGLGPAALTVTVGLGPKVFTDTYGLAHRRPALLRALKRLPSDNLKPEFTGGDLSLQVCADDLQVAYHAVRFLARIAKETGAADIRWMVEGFLSAPASASDGPGTPRNLLGFKDGTRNIHAHESEAVDKFVRVQDGPAWQRNGSYQVVRKIRMYLESWDTDQIGDQNDIFGRHKSTGAPLTGNVEFDDPDFHKKDGDGNPIIPDNSHIRLVSYENNGFRILRRSYNYTEGIDQLGALDAGLLFICYQNDPARFETLQGKLGASDELNEYITHIGSAIFFVPPAPPVGAYIGQPIFA